MLSEKTAIILATGPSLTPEVLIAAREGQQRGLWKVYGMNRLWRDFPTLDNFHACNKEFYDMEWTRGLDKLACPKTTIDLQTAKRYGIQHLTGEWRDGFSRKPGHVHYGHSSGFQTPQLAYQSGFTRIILCGYDMRYAANYDGRNHRIGSSPRHYFGEYKDAQLNHWPSVMVKDGVHVELIEQFEKVKRINTDVEIINCSIGSAMTCFPIVPLTEILNGRHNLRSEEVQDGMDRRPSRDTLRLGLKARRNKAAKEVDSDADREVRH